MSLCYLYLSVGNRVGPERFLVTEMGSSKCGRKEKWDLL